MALQALGLYAGFIWERLLNASMNIRAMMMNENHVGLYNVERR